MDIVKALKAGRNPLVMSERLEQLNNIRIYVNTLAKRNGLNITQGMYIGGKSDKQLEEASACNVVYATIQLAKEGVDIPRLDTLFLASPLGEVEQLTGRVVRFKEGKKQPFVIDYVDLNIGCFKNSFISRYKLYKKLDFEVNGVSGNQFGFLDYIK
jgi:predicted helicase